MISIGSKDQWDFEVAVVRNTPCHVHTFDCTIANTTRPPVGLRSRVTFYHACLVPFNLKRQPQDAPNFENFETGGGLNAEGLGELWNWTTLLGKVGLRVGPQYVKADIEGMEYSTLYSIIEEMRLQNTMYKLPQQLSIEFHNSGHYHVRRAKQAHRGLLPKKQMLKWFYHFYQVGRYLMIDHAPNLSCPNCDEALFGLVN